MQVSVSRYRWVAFGAMTFVGLNRVPVGVALGILLPSISQELGLSLIEQGWLGGALNLGNIFVGVPAAWLVSRWNARWVLGLSSAFSALLTIVQALAPSFLPLMAARALSGIARDANAPARVILVRQWFPLSEVVLTMGIFIACVGVVEWLTFALTPRLLNAVGGWRNVMMLFGAMGLVATLVWFALGREGPGQDHGKQGPDDRVSPITVLWRRKVLWIVALSQIGGPGSWWAFGTFWPSYALDRFHLPLELSGFLFGLTSLGMAPASLLTGWFSSRRPEWRPALLVVCGLLLCLSSLGMLLTGNPVLLFILCLGGGFGWAFVPIVTSFPYELPAATGREVAIASSFLMTTGSAGSVVGPVLAGWLAESTGDMALALAILALFALLVSFAAFAVRRA